MVGEASDWEVVKAVLTAEYAMPKQEAWRRHVNCRLEAVETVDVYLGCLKRLGSRLCLTHEQAYTAYLGSVLTRVRNRIVLRRAVEGHTYSSVIAAASGKQQGSSSSCYRCGGGHRVKQCHMKSTGKGITPKKASSKKKVVCFCCGSI